MSSWRTILQVKKGKNNVLSKEIAIDRGIFQGDSLSPTLFCLCFTVISYHIRDLKLGYTLGAPNKRQGNQIITHTLLMDDLKIYSTSHRLLEKVIKKATYVMEATGLNLSLEKCAVLSTKAGRETSTNNLMISQDKIIEGLNDGKSYMYLGMAQRSDCQEQIIKTSLLEEFFRRNKIIWQSLLSTPNKVKAYRSLCLGVLGYSFGVIGWTNQELENIDIKVRKIMTMNGAFFKNSDVDRLYISREKGGKGMLNIRDYWQRMCLSTLVYILRSRTVQGKAIKQFYMHKKEGTLLQQGENVIDELDTSMSITEEGKIMQNEVELMTHQIGKRVKDRQEQIHLENLKRKPLHGIFYRKAEEQDVDIKESFAWLEGKGLTSWTESRVMALQEQEIAVKTIRKEIWKEHLDDVKCRVCKKDRETVAHIMCGCSVLLQTEYLKRHNGMLRAVYCHLLQQLGFEEGLLPWYTEEYVEKVKENNKCTLFWDFQFETDRVVESTRPDIVVIMKECKELIIIEGSIPGDMNLSSRAESKAGKYLGLATELKRLYGLKSIKLYDIIIGACGTILKGTKNTFKELFDKQGSKAMKLCQQATIMGTLKIFRNVLGQA